VPITLSRFNSKRLGSWAEGKKSRRVKTTHKRPNGEKSRKIDSMEQIFHVRFLRFLIILKQKSKKSTPISIQQSLRNTN
jgi:hypothetical protein